MYEVELQVVLTAKAHRDPIGLSRTVQLPFAPFPGLALEGLMDDSESLVVIETVVYHVLDRNFWCELADGQFDPDEEEDGIPLTIGEKIAEYGDEWEVNEPGDDGEEGDGQEG